LRALTDAARSYADDIPRRRRLSIAKRQPKSIITANLRATGCIHHNFRLNPEDVTLSNSPMIRRVILAVFACAAATDLSAGDWPQILGPNRNGIAADDERLAETWPESGPKLLWEQPVGRGFAAVAVVGERAIVFDRDRNTERVQALNVATGESNWDDAYPTDFVPQYGRDDGPMATPAIANDRVCTFGAQGVLSCYDLNSGELLWRRDTHEDFGAREGYFGAGSSPLIDDGKVIVIVGGEREAEAAVVAFDLTSGETAWHSVADDASYSSPVVATVDGTRHLIALTRLKCVSLDPADGGVRFEFPYGLRGPTVTAANPLVIDGKLFISASYGIGAVYAAIQQDGVQELWSGDDILSSQYTTCVEHDGLLYGVDGRQDIPPADLKCFDPVTRDVKWVEPAFGYASLIAADGKLIIVKTDGGLVLAELSPASFQPLAQARIFQDTVRALPALSNGRLYLRDSHTLKCLSLTP
jgi:outer membrane protein assembly factor BamB